MTFQELLCAFSWTFPQPFISILHDLPGLFNQAAIVKVRFSHTCTKCG